ncbi:MAG TPA: archaeal proteasome endopeptidase complex subunit beta [Candidatus Krumholzibacteriaceae bacterium]|nr:archaeal proteasome endopeptidase complex subunit beta [Candidatus Krumholzibacteriaceae bacterium]
MRETPNELVMKGTTTIGVVGRDGVVLASDTRVTMGYFVAHHKGKKIYQIDQHLAMTIAGNVADAQKAVDILKANAQLYRLNYERLMPVNTAARVLANLLFSTRYAPLVTQVLVGGVDNTGPHVYAIDPFGSITEEKCVSTGSGSPIAYGILEDKYNEDAKIKELAPIVVKAVKSAMKRDTASGDSFDVVIIDENGVKELNDKEKESITEES